MWDAGKPNSLNSQLADFDSFEKWYRTGLRGRLVQVLMELSIHSLYVMMCDTDMDDQTAVLNTMALLRPLDGNARTKVELYDIKTSVTITLPWCCPGAQTKLRVLCRR